MQLKEQPTQDRTELKLGLKRAPPGALRAAKNTNILNFSMLDAHVE